MRIFNGTNSALDIPLSGMQRIQVGPKSVSGDFLPSTDFLSVLISGYDYSEVALIVSGSFEINLCSGVPGCVGFIAQSLEEAIERFNPKETVTPTEEIITTPEPIETPEEKKEEEIIKEEVELEAEPVVIPSAVNDEAGEENKVEEEKEVVKEKKPATKKSAGKKTTKK